MQNAVLIWLIGQAVKTPPSHGGNRGSIPLSAVRYLNRVVICRSYGSLVKRLRRRPLTAETGVRFPYELLTILKRIAQPEESAGNQVDGFEHFFYAYFSCLNSELFQKFLKVLASYVFLVYSVARLLRVVVSA